ncbi:MAG: glutamate dehydrogenase, partial [Rhizorhabdus sp.]|nr:glutamate dehydrogenase [Rhizorhabdus sp.]
MDAVSKTRDSADDHDLEAIFAHALTEGALPGETHGLSAGELTAAAAFVAQTAQHRLPGKPAIAIRSIAGDATRHRAMQIAIVNDDMPFLVDSVAGALAAHGIEIHRLLHPVAAIRRDEQGELTALLPGTATGERRESIIYLEAERVDARKRQALIAELEHTLADVRAAVRDWPAMQVALRDDAEKLPDGEGAALLRWLLDGNFTLLGHRTDDRDGKAAERQGILRSGEPALWPAEAREAAIFWFENGGPVPLVSKADVRATVHRRAPLDMIVLPVREGKAITGLSIHTGLWTSAALRAPSEEVPILRTRLTTIEEKLGFDPKGHAGKALRHALAELPHDLLITLPASGLEQVALTAMSLVDRPRPRLELVASTLGRHLIAFVWLPRELLTTARRVAIGEMLTAAAGATLSNWSLQLGEGDIAQIRYTLDLPAVADIPDAEALDLRLSEMLRGWEPAVEAKLAEIAPNRRSTRLAIDYAAAFPPAYRTHSNPGEAAADILRLASLADGDARNVRLYRSERDPAERMRLKIYRVGALIPLSEAVP